VNPLTGAIVLALVAAVAGLLVAEHRQDLRGRWLTKPLASTCFVVLGWQVGALEQPWGGAMLAGFVGCWWGDVLLIPKDRRAFLAGIVAFALGHVGFAVAFAQRGIDPVRAAATAVLLLPLGGVVLRWLWPHVAGVMRVAVPAYVLIICTMVALAAGTTGVVGSGSGLGLLLGATLFWLSDLCVARERFVTTGFVNRAVGLPLYYGALVVLALACAR